MALLSKSKHEAELSLLVSNGAALREELGNCLSVIVTLGDALVTFLSVTFTLGGEENGTGGDGFTGAGNLSAVFNVSAYFNSAF